jgi:hypothetical protein
VLQALFISPKFCKVSGTASEENDKEYHEPLRFKRERERERERERKSERERKISKNEYFNRLYTVIQWLVNECIR